MQDVHDGKLLRYNRIARLVISDRDYFPIGRHLESVTWLVWILNEKEFLNYNFL